MHIDVGIISLEWPCTTNEIVPNCWIERKGAQTITEHTLWQYKVDIDGLSEVRLTDSGHKVIQVFRIRCISLELQPAREVEIQMPFIENESTKLRGLL